MPVYRAIHECGYTNEQFLKADKQSVVIVCKRCKRQVVAKQVRDTSATITEKNEVMGIYQDERN